MKTYQTIVIEESTQQKLEQMFIERNDTEWKAGGMYRATFEEFVGETFEKLFKEANQ
ncbi:MAG: hypothetical protein ABFD07_17910 [Methanobacterium sp.]